MAFAVCASDSPSSSGSTTACAALNSSAVFAVRNASRASANWSTPPALRAMTSSLQNHGDIIAPSIANWNYDPQPFHLNAVVAAESIYGGLIASGFQVVALTFRLFIQSGMLADSSMGSRGIDELRWFPRRGRATRCMRKSR